ncbi:hypothetical protein [Haloferula sp.]
MTEIKLQNQKGPSTSNSLPTSSRGADWGEEALGVMVGDDA